MRRWKGDAAGESRLGFTLIELLVIVAIIGIMLGGAVMSVGSGSASAQMKSATRRVLQLSRQARTMALLRQQAAVITYEEIYDGQSFVGGKVSIESKGETGAKPSASNVKHFFPARYSGSSALI